MCQFCESKYAFVAREPSADAERRTIGDIVPIVPDAHVLQPTGEPQAKWNPRYLAYAATQSLTPVQVMALDEERWPGGRACGFILWIGERWREWDSLHGFRRDHIRCTSEHNAFDAWLRGEHAITRTP